MIRNRALSLAFFTLLAAPIAWSQQPAPAAPMPGPTPRADLFKERMGMRGGMDGGGMGIVPPGTWWRNPSTITALSLSADQQKKMDDIFLQNRIALIHLHASLEEEQLKLEPLLNANPPDQAKSLAEISKIADLRADLEKADAKMLLSLRGVLSADQWTKLQADQHGRHDRGNEERGPKRAPDAPRGPGGPNVPTPPGGPQSQGPRGSMDLDPIVFELPAEPVIIPADR
jgi:Spy/CpxP family protein refolding chaperone